MLCSFTRPHYGDVRNYIPAPGSLLRGFDWKENILMRTRSEIWAGKEARKGKTWWEWEAGNWESFTQIITYLSPDWRGTKTALPAPARLLQAAPGCIRIIWVTSSFEENNEEFLRPPNQAGSSIKNCWYWISRNKLRFTDWLRKSEKLLYWQTREWLQPDKKCLQKLSDLHIMQVPAPPDNSWEQQQPICWLFDMQM